MSTFEERRAARRERLLGRARKLQAESNDLWDRSGEGLPPMGEPIKIGHHSEGRHRRALERSWQRMGKSIAAAKEAAEIERRADAVGTGGISSDDPDAILKLQAKLDGLKEAQEHMKACNAAFRRGGADALRELEPKHAETILAEMAKPWHYDKRRPFLGYALSNNLAEIKRIERRVADLKAKAARQPAEAKEGAGWRFVEDLADNRYRFEFEGKPADDVRAVLKRHAFKWSPNRGAWVRQITPAAKWAVANVIKHLSVCPA